MTVNKSTIIQNYFILHLLLIAMFANQQRYWRPNALNWYYDQNLWISAPREQRRQFMQSWLLSQKKISSQYINWLLTPGCHQNEEMNRRTHLQNIFNRPWGSVPFLSNTPQTKRLLRARFAYQARKAKEMMLSPVHEDKDAPLIDPKSFKTPAKKCEKDEDVASILMSIDSLFVSGDRKKREADGESLNLMRRQLYQTPTQEESSANDTSPSTNPDSSTNISDDDCYRPSHSSSEDDSDSSCDHATYDTNSPPLMSPCADWEHRIYSSTMENGGVEIQLEGESTSSAMNTSADKQLEGASTSAEAMNTSISHESCDQDNSGVEVFINSQCRATYPENETTAVKVPSIRTIERYVKKFEASIVSTTCGNGNEVPMAVKIALDTFTTSRSLLDGDPIKSAMIIATILEKTTEEKGVEWMDRHFIPALRAKFSLLSEERERNIMASYGRNTIEFMKMLKGTSNHIRGRKGDISQHSFDTLLSAVQPTQGSLPEPIPKAQKRFGSHYNTLLRARDGRRALNNFLSNKERVNAEYEETCKEFYLRVQHGPTVDGQQIQNNSWKMHFYQGINVTVNTMLTKIQQHFCMSELLSEHLHLRYKTFSRKKWKHVYLNKLHNGNEKVFRKVKIEERVDDYLTVAALELCILPKDVDEEDNHFSSVRHQAQRKDNIDFLIAPLLHEFCHDFRYSQVDSNCSRPYKVVLWNGKEEVHIRHNWSNPGNDSMQLIRFMESNYYDRLREEAKEHCPEIFTLKPPHVPLGKFKDMKCSCIRDKGHAACVDVIQDTVENELNCIQEWINTKTHFRRNKAYFDNLFQQCSSCTHNFGDRQEKNWFNITKLDSEKNQDLLSQVCDIALCPREVHEDLKMSDEQLLPFRLRSQNCSLGLCEHCSVEENLPFNCEGVTKCEDEVQCWVWKSLDEDIDTENNSGSTNSNNNRIPVKTGMPVNVVFNNLKAHLKEYVKHNFHLKWQKRMMKLDIDSFTEKTLLLFTDYASIVNMKPPKSECCTWDPHAVLAVFVVLHGKELVKLRNGEEIDFTNCDHWFVVVGSESEGKMNDWVTHGAAVDKICEHYIEKEGKKFDILRIWTDNCPPQYKNRKNFFQLAILLQKYGFKMVEHCFGSIYGFKGVWDALGKIVKLIVTEWEQQNDHYAYNAYQYYIVLRNTFATKLPKDTNWIELRDKKDLSLKEKTPMQAIRRFIIYGTDRKEEVEEIGERPTVTLLSQTNSEEATNDAIKEASKTDRIMYLNRDWTIKNQDTTALPETNSNFHFRITKDDIFIAHELSKDDCNLIGKYYSQRDAYSLPNNTPATVIKCIDEFEEVWRVQRNHADEQQCRHCKNNFQPFIIAIHEVFCDRNKSNSIFPIEYRNRPCFCINCQAGDPCTHANVTGAFNTHNMMLLTHKIKRDSLERVLKIVKSTANALETAKTAIVMLVRLQHPDFPNSIPPVGTVEKWPTIESLSRQTKSDQIKAITKLLELQVIGTGMRGNVKKIDNEKAIDTAGGWRVIFQKWFAL